MKKLLRILGFETVEDITQDLHEYKKRYLTHSERSKGRQSKFAAKAEKANAKASFAGDQAKRAARKAKQLDQVIGDAEAQT